MTGCVHYSISNLLRSDGVVLGGQEHSHIVVGDIFQVVGGRIHSTTDILIRQDFSLDRSREIG